jgi:hypothetical protein
MKTAALIASLALHVVGLLAVPTDSKAEEGSNTAAPTAIVAHVSSCACDLEIAACPPAQAQR